MRLPSSPRWRGWWGWVVCGAALLQFTLVIGVLVSFSETLVVLRRERGWSATTLGWIGATSLCLPMSAAPLATYLYNRWRCMRTVMLGILIATMSLAFTALAETPGSMFFLYGICYGLGGTLILNPPFFLLDEYFPLEHPRHVLATSIVACAFPLVMAVLLFVIGILTTLTYIPNLERIPRDKYGGIFEIEREPILQSDIKIAKRTRIIMSIIWFFASTFKSVGYYTPFIILVMHMKNLGITQQLSATGMSIIGLCELVSRVITSAIGDRFKGRFLRIYISFCLSLCVENIVGAFATNYAQMMVYGVALGVSGGPIIAAMWTSCSEVLDGQHVPMLFTVFRIGLGLGNFIGPPIAGAVYDLSGSYTALFYINGVIYFLAACLYGLIILLNTYRPAWCFPGNAYPAAEAADPADVTMESLTQLGDSQRALQQEMDRFVKEDKSYNTMGEVERIKVQRQRAASVRSDSESDAGSVTSHKEKY